MNHDGKHLEASFARVSLDKTKSLMRSAISKWKHLSTERGDDVKDVPTARLDNTLGKPAEPGGAKLRVTIRDLPRDDGKLQSGEWWYPQAINFNWVDLTREEMSEFLTTSRDGKSISPKTFEKLFLKTLKDNARGQMDDWKKQEFRDGQLISKLVRNEGDEYDFEIIGSAEFRSDKASYKGQLLGRATFDRAKHEFTSFELCGSGTRSGKGGASGRNFDPDGTPLGHLYRLVPR